MNEIKKQIEAIKKQIYADIKRANDEETIENIRIKFLGRNGLIAKLMTQLKKLPVEEKRVVGPLLNDLKKNAETAIAQAQEMLTQRQRELALRNLQYFDVTAYKPKGAQGSIHIYSQITQQIEDIFISMGYEIVDGPEVETEYYNFDALNIPPDHPARDLFDTFWLTNPGWLLRTHTSPVQIREMEKKGAPLAIVAPGRAYRHEAVDASHNFMFRQYEGLLIGKNISIANLLATAQAFFQAFFEKENLDIRVRPGYFPFVEPGLEIDASCPFCKTGCSVCKGTRWIELLGAGLVHPNVLRSGGIDPDIYSGFAWGGGIERLAMIKYG
ncbi:phenylalanine--tRNA ligase subunit alpha, partial [Candidatus Dependentiae bacterium]